MIVFAWCCFPSCYWFSCTHLLCDSLSLSLSSLFSCIINKCFILQIVLPSFGVLLLLLEGWFCEGDFFRPRMLAALEIGANEDVSLEVWRGHSWVDGCSCLLMLPPSCFWFSCTQFIVWLSLSHLWLSLTLMRSQLLPMSAHSIVGDSWVYPFG